MIEPIWMAKARQGKDALFAQQVQRNEESGARRRVPFSESLP